MNYVGPKRGNTGFALKHQALLALGCLLIGFGAGYMAPAFEQEPALKVVAPKATFKTAYARTACIGHPILNAQGGWSVVFEPGEC